ncbi:MAG: Hpt domain-containing protein [Paracoccaceae bacterium]
MFRDLHTVKGSGAMFGFTELAAFIHEFETVFDRIRASALAVGPEILRLALAARTRSGLVEGWPIPRGGEADPCRVAGRDGRRGPCRGMRKDAAEVAAVAGAVGAGAVGHAAAFGCQGGSAGVGRAARSAAGGIARAGRRGDRGRSGGSAAP